MVIEVPRVDTKMLIHEIHEDSKSLQLQRSSMQNQNILMTGASPKTQLSDSKFISSSMLGESGAPGHVQTFDNNFAKNNKNQDLVNDLMKGNSSKNARGRGPVRMHSGSPSGSGSANNKGHTRGGNPMGSKHALSASSQRGSAGKDASSQGFKQCKYNSFVTHFCL